MASSSSTDKDVFATPASSTRSKKQSSMSKEPKSSELSDKHDSSFESKSEMSEEEDTISFDLKTKCLKFASELDKFDGLDVSLI